MKLAALLGTCALLYSGAILAHTPYLVSPEFTVRGGQTVTLDAAFAEEFFTPELAFAGSEFRVTGPDGVARALDKVEVLKLRTVVEHALPKADGTYRFSTGRRHGAVFRTYELDGKKVTTRDAAAAIPAGANVLSDFQAITRAETYLTAGKPDNAALAAHGQGLELVAQTHPNDLYAGEPVRFQVLFEGKPVPDIALALEPAVWSSDAKVEPVKLQADAGGVVQWPAATAGTWLALVRHRAPAPASAGVREYSHTYTLTFQVLNP